jgi:CHAD domain-containing protein
MGTVITCRGIGATPDALVHDLAAAGFDVGPPRRATTTVLDTFDGRLHEAGLRLDHTDAALVLRGPAASVATAPTPEVPRFPSELAPGPMRARLIAVTEVRAVLPSATITVTTRRAERRNRDGKVVAVVTIHEDLEACGAALDGWLAAVEELTGYAGQAEDSRRLVAQHVGEPVHGDVVDAALDLAGVDRAGRHVDPGIPLDPKLAACEGFRLVLANLAEAIAVNLPGTIGAVDPEFLHDLRVAVRRTRSVLRHGRNVLPADVLAWAEPEMKRIAGVTSLPRDLDVQVIEWDRHVAALDDAAAEALEPLRRQLLADRDAAYRELHDRLGGADVTAVRARWDETLGTPIDPATAGSQGGDPIGAVVRRRIRKAQRRLLRNGRAITPETPAAAVHEVRKDAKKLRYLLECFAGVLPGDARKAFVKRLKKLQDLLGEHQDAEVQAANMRLAAEELPPSTGAATYLAVGRLVEQLERSRQAARDGFAERFAAYDSAATRKSLDDLLDGIGA